MKEIVVYTDGSCLNNPGAGGYCAILLYKDKKKVIKGGEDNTTNNKMEIKGVLEALRALKEPCKIELFTDSNYVCEAINSYLEKWVKRNWSEVKNIELWKEYLELSKPHEIKANWIKAHSGHEYNEECDRIAKSEAYRIKNGEQEGFFNGL